MAFQFYMEIKGKTQGSFKGESTKNGKSNGAAKGVVCHGFQYALQTPFDAASGLPTGKRQHNAVVITKEVDSTSPNLFHAFATNEGFESAKFSFVKPDSSGKEVVFKTVELTNGTVSKIDYAPPVLGKRSQSITLTFEELAVDGAKNGAIPHSLLGASFRGPWG